MREIATAQGWSEELRALAGRADPTGSWACRGRLPWCGMSLAVDAPAAELTARRKPASPFFSRCLRPSPAGASTPCKVAGFQRVLDAFTVAPPAFLEPWNSRGWGEPLRPRAPARVQRWSNGGRGSMDLIPVWSRGLVVGCGRTVKPSHSLLSSRRAASSDVSCGAGLTLLAAPPSSGSERAFREIWASLRSPCGSAALARRLGPAGRRGVASSSRAHRPAVRRAPALRAAACLIAAILTLPFGAGTDAGAGRAPR